MSDFVAGKFGKHEDYKLLQMWHRLFKPIESNLNSYLGSKTLFNRHQNQALLINGANPLKSPVYLLVANR